MSAKVIKKKKIAKLRRIERRNYLQAHKKSSYKLYGKNANPLSIREVKSNVLFVSVLPFFVLPFFETASRFLKKNQLIFKYH